MKRFILALPPISLASIAFPEEVGNVDVVWLGNDIIIDAFNDPEELCCTYLWMGFTV